MPTAHHGNTTAAAVMSVPLYQAKSEFFRTLGHPVRIRILELLAEGDRAVRELGLQIPVGQSSLSQQLGILRRTSLVASHRIGGEVIYSLTAPEVRDLLLAARRILGDRAAGMGDFENDLAVVRPQ